jgi:hypothetical protein
MGVVDRISSDKSLILGRHFRITARSAAEILVPVPDVGSCWKPDPLVQLDHEPGFGTDCGICCGCCWVGSWVGIWRGVAVDTAGGVWVKTGAWL